MGKFKLVGIIFLVVAVLTGIKIYFIVTTPKSLNSSTAVQSPEDLNDVSALPINAEEWKAKKNKLSEEIMKLNEHPDGIEKKLNQFSIELSSSEIKVLRSELNDLALSAEARSLSTELLIRNKSMNGFKALIDFLEDKRYANKNEFENKMRMHVIEGLAQYPNKDDVIVSLEKLEMNEKNLYLADGYRRMVVGLRFNKSIPQDEAKSKKLLDQQIN